MQQQQLWEDGGKLEHEEEEGLAGEGRKYTPWFRAACFRSRAASASPPCGRRRRVSVRTVPGLPCPPGRGSDAWRQQQLQQRQR